jgi:L-asparaginase
MAKSASKSGVHFVMTGGTIDSKWDARKDTVVPLEKSLIPEYIASLQMPWTTSFTQVCMKDSREITDADRKRVLDAVESSIFTRFVVTHGTYTMPDTARYLAARLKRTDAVVVLTGAFVPLEQFTLSDSGFNLGFAVSKTESLAPGVYLCMNGRAFAANEVVKLVEEGRFAPVENQRD